MQQLKELLTQLVAFPTISDRSNRALIDYVQRLLHGYDIQTHLVESADGDKASLHCRIGPAVDGGIILSGHTDVVPVEGQPWHSDPFRVAERDGRLYGRGTADMKGFLACCLEAVPEMTRAALQRPFYLAFSYDEEVGCRAAPALIAHMKQTYRERPRFAIIGEPSGMQPVVGQKGIGTFRTTVTGSAGHSSRIREEVSAVHVAARLIGWLEDQMDALISAGRHDDRFSPNHTTLHAGTIHGGIAPNVIADHCFFDWDLRVIPADDPQEIYEKFLDHCRSQERDLRQRFSGARIVTILHQPFVPTLDTREDSAIVPLIRRWTGVDRLSTVAYAAEAGQFAGAGFEAVICGPGYIEQAHRADEFIDLSQLEAGRAFLRQLIVAGCSLLGDS